MEGNVTSFQQLQEYAKGQIVELPPFADDMPFVARLRRPSLLAMMKSGKIPNSLLSSANSLFSGNTEKDIQDDETLYKEIFDVIEILTNSALIEPTLAQVKEAGLELTDDQLMFVFNYTQRGVKALENFRTIQNGYANNQHGESVQNPAV